MHGTHCTLELREPCNPAQKFGGRFLLLGGGGVIQTSLFSRSQPSVVLKELQAFLNYGQLILRESDQTGEKKLDQKKISRLRTFL